MNHKRIYWGCQLAGWLGMVAIEVINFTFFIVGQFNIKLLWVFLSYALLGIVITHLYRYYLIKTNFFKKSLSHVWIAALISALVISSILSLANLIEMGANQNFFKLIKSTRVIDIIGLLINWLRYAGVWIIIYFMYHILEQNKTIEHEKLRLENLSKTTELELLKTQLNPHFLFNALNSIKALVTIDPEVSRDAIVKLSELLRFTLQYGKEKVIAIQQEIKEVEKYLALEQIRFGSRLTVTYNIEEGALQHHLPPAILLTLAENAVKHGVCKQMGDCIIDIIITTEEDFVILKVINTGVYQPTEHKGIGLLHITKRLEEVFDNKASFSIENQSPNVLTTLKVPTIWN